MTDTRHHPFSFTMTKRRGCVDAKMREARCSTSLRGAGGHAAERAMSPLTGHGAGTAACVHEGCAEARGVFALAC